MKSYEQRKSSQKKVVQEPLANYKKAEMDLLQDALTRSYTERFDRMMQLIKMNRMFRNAKITPPDQSSLNAK